MTPEEGLAHIAATPNGVVARDVTTHAALLGISRPQLYRFFIKWGAQIERSRDPDGCCRLRFVARRQTSDEATPLASSEMTLSGHDAGSTSIEDKPNDLVVDPASAKSRLSRREASCDDRSPQSGHRGEVRDKGKNPSSLLICCRVLAVIVALIDIGLATEGLQALFGLDRRIAAIAGIAPEILKYGMPVAIGLLGERISRPVRWGCLVAVIAIILFDTLTIGNYLNECMLQKIWVEGNGTAAQSVPIAPTKSLASQEAYVRALQESRDLLIITVRSAMSSRQLSRVQALNGQLKTLDAEIRSERVALEHEKEVQRLRQHMQIKAETVGYLSLVPGVTPRTQALVVTALFALMLEVASVIFTSLCFSRRA